MRRSAAEKKMLDAMTAPEEREALVDLLKHRMSSGALVSRDRLMECASSKAFDALLDFEYTIGQETEIFSK